MACARDACCCTKRVVIQSRRREARAGWKVRHPPPCVRKSSLAMMPPQSPACHMTSRALPAIEELTTKSDASWEVTSVNYRIPPYSPIGIIGTIYIYALGYRSLAGRAAPKLETRKFFLRLAKMMSFRCKRLRSSKYTDRFSMGGARGGISRRILARCSARYVLSALRFFARAARTFRSSSSDKVCRTSRRPATTSSATRMARLSCSRNMLSLLIFFGGSPHGKTERK